jgi:hypothetical protein
MEQVRTEEDLMIRASVDGLASVADDEAIAQMERVADEYHANEHNGRRLRIHLVLRNQQLVDALRRTPLSGKLMDNIELYTYTDEDLNALDILGINPAGTFRLDSQPITLESSQRVHLVIFGASGQAESLAINAAQVAHYPNYCRDNTLRTRITMVSDSMSDFYNFRQRFANLLRHSYCREVKISENGISVSTTAPKYAETRKDFVDIEWEFVESTTANSALNYKLTKWASDANQQLTIAFCSNVSDENISNALALPRELRESDCRIFVKVDNPIALNLLKQSSGYDNIHPFGFKGSNQQHFTTVIRLAQLVNYAYCTMDFSSIEAQRQGSVPVIVATELPTQDLLDEYWSSNDAQGYPNLNTPKRWSNIYNAFSITTKMRSIGIDVARWGSLFTIGDRDVELLAEVEHNRWNVEELILGFEPTTEAEHQEVLADISKKDVLKQEFKHEDLRNYDELGVDKTGLSIKRYDQGLTHSIPMIAYAYKHLD